MNISLVGLGKLGLPFISVLADAGHKCIGVDINPAVVEQINQGRSPVCESGLDELIKLHGGKQLLATTEHSLAIKETDVTFILTPTPSLADGSFSNHQVEDAVIKLAEHFGRSDKAYHLFVISSTVVPGSVENSFIPLIQQHSGKILNKDFGVAYNPDFVALGNVIEDFRRPDLIIIGESDKRAGDLVEGTHKSMCENVPHISRMSIINAEIAKVCLNVYITLKVTFANTVANLCESIPGADCDAVTKSIGPDKRISPYYFSGGLSYGGPCFPRDTRAFVTIAKQYGQDAPLVRACDQINDYQDEHLLDVVVKALNHSINNSVGLLGMAFKEHTTFVHESPSIKLCAKLTDMNVDVYAYDAIAVPEVKEELRTSVHICDSIEDLTSQCGVVAVMYRSKVFKQVIENLKPEKPIFIIDCWRILDPAKLHSNIIIKPLGKWSRYSSEAFCVGLNM